MQSCSPTDLGDCKRCQNVDSKRCIGACFSEKMSGRLSELGVNPTIFFDKEYDDNFRCKRRPNDSSSDFFPAMCVQHTSFFGAQFVWGNLSYDQKGLLLMASSEKAACIPNLLNIFQETTSMSDELILRTVFSSSSVWMSTPRIFTVAILFGFMSNLSNLSTTKLENIGREVHKSKSFGGVTYLYLLMYILELLPWLMEDMGERGRGFKSEYDDICTLKWNRLTYLVTQGFLGGISFSEQNMFSDFSEGFEIVWILYYNSRKGNLVGETYIPKCDEYFSQFLSNIKIVATTVKHSSDAGGKKITETEMNDYLNVCPS
jgi:hypothetical protein